ncbi:rRNA-processing protein [Mycena indigotica]|uniref:rRNA-processing protein n=1 Tax=Mycena indigotica TaxID=2126181 RepID=A0A8H6W5Q8_9AGAR|nr:rRNA-processing protein [Mycena indigotica]KAF7306794.1 rRNA-processing protein [Mycena indigotica]
MGRVSGRTWKPQQTATRRTHLQPGLKQSWEDRIAQSTKLAAVKKLENELKEEKQAERTQRVEKIKARRKAAEERRRLEEDKAKMGARKAARLRRKAGRSKKVNG